jgi:site-specific DNA-methyltransferase (adenine-specific)
VWDKGRGVSFLSANKMPMRSHEMMYVFSKAGAYYNRVDISGDFPRSMATNPRKSIQGQILPNTLKDNTGKRCVKSVIFSDGYQTRGKGQHPTEKPVELYKFLIERYCPAGGTVLDPTFGSGNSGLACLELGRKYIGIEKDETFFKKAKEKLEKNLSP